MRDVQCSHACVNTTTAVYLCQTYLRQAFEACDAYSNLVSHT